MSDIIYIFIGAICCMAIIGMVSYSIIRGQQRTIDRLTDKLMAKDYREYMQHSTPHTEVTEKPKRITMSYHDDADIPTEEEIIG